jgi:hypothetical protein
MVELNRELVASRNQKLNGEMIHEVPSVFISYNHKDKPQANWLAKYLRKSGVRVWWDEDGLGIGDSLIVKIAKAIKHTDFVTALLSQNSIQSAWVEKELSMAMTKEIEGRKVVVLPIKIDDCELPNFLIDKLYADLSSTRRFETELKKIANTLGVNPIDWPDLERMYSSRDWQTILMVQTFADRREWGGPSSHCVKPRRRLKRILKVFGGYKHPVPEPQATQQIENAINNILALAPDILGLGGKGETAIKIEKGLQDAGFEGKIDYWGGDVGRDACEFLKMNRVDPRQW